MSVVMIRSSRRGDQRLPRLSTDQLRRILSDPSARVITEQTVRQSQESHRRVSQQVLEELNRLYARSPELLRRLQSLTRDTRQVEPSYVESDREGNRQQFRLLGGDAVIRDVIFARKYLTDQRHRAASYTHLYETVRDTVARSATSEDQQRVISQLPDPEELRLHSVREIDRAILTLAEVINRWLQPPADDRPPGYPSSCGVEEGTGTGGDTTETCSNPSENPKGLLAQSDWPLKWYNTCVRNQRARGTCSAFGVVAAVESAIAVKHNRWVNLSEQDLYKRQKLDWDPNPFDHYGDGYAPPFSLLLQMVGWYTFPWERDWDYNPSPNRQENDQTRTYTQSCTGYTGLACSDTNHQAQEVCYQAQTTEVNEVVEEVCGYVSEVPIIGGFLGTWVCEPVTKVVEEVKNYTVCVYQTTVPGTSNFRVNNISMIWDPIFSTDLAIARTYLNLKIPIVLTFSVPASFGTANHDPDDGRGFVVFNNNETLPANAGSHAALLTGYIPNDQLPSNVKPGAGGGYFILKNSWGHCAGDLGYYYLPASWVNKWGLYMVSVNSISP
jgi:hypothetical protein